MRILLCLLLSCLPVFGQGFKLNKFTTNQNNTLGATSSAQYPIMLDSASGTFTPNGVLFSPHFSMVDTNGRFGGDLSLNLRTNRLSISADGQLLLDGVPIASTTETNITLNSYISNLFFISGKGNTLVITQALTIQALKTNLVATTSTGLLTNANYGSGISWDPSTLTISSSAGGDTTWSNIVTLTQTGTNVSSMNYALVAGGGAFKLQLTNTAYIGAPSGVASTPFLKAWLIVQQPSTGTCFLTFTNGFYEFPEGVAPIIDTNNGAVTIYQFVSDPITNGLLHGWMSLKSKLIP